MIYRLPYARRDRHTSRFFRMKYSNSFDSFHTVCVCVRAFVCASEQTTYIRYSALSRMLKYHFIPGPHYATSKPRIHSASVARN